MVQSGLIVFISMLKSAEIIFSSCSLMEMVERHNRENAKIVCKPKWYNGSDLTKLFSKYIPRMVKIKLVHLLEDEIHPGVNSKKSMMGELGEAQHRH